MKKKATKCIIMSRVWIVVDILGDGKCAIQEVSSRILKAERVVDVGRLKVLF